VLCISSCIVWPCGLLPLKKLYSVHFPLSTLVHGFWWSLVLELPVYSGYQFLVSCIADKHFIHSVGSLFNLENIFFVVKFFNFLVVPFVNSFS
jgi:hypothetical protein